MILATSRAVLCCLLLVSSTQKLPRFLQQTKCDQIPRFHHDLQCSAARFASSNIDCFHLESRVPQQSCNDLAMPTFSSEMQSRVVISCSPVADSCVKVLAVQKQQHHCQDARTAQTHAMLSPHLLWLQHSLHALGSGCAPEAVVLPLCALYMQPCAVHCTRSALCKVIAVNLE